jgi:hypothetical protein
MASPNLPVFSSPDFPQGLAQAIDRAVTRVLRVADESQLSCCSYESGESRVGACDSVPCIQKATVHHLELEQGFCLAHFREVSRG